MTILFYKLKDPCGCFSNFSKHGVAIYGHIWATSEAAFQASKFIPHRLDIVDKIHKARTPKEAADIGRDSSNPIRSDWEQPPAASLAILLSRRPQLDDGLSRENSELVFSRVKDVLMYEVVVNKVKQNKEVHDTLLRTGDQAIIEASPIDAYWGWGPSENGQNKLGRILMVIRELLRKV